jgi:hypothetical protein
MRLASPARADRRPHARATAATAELEVLAGRHGRRRPAAASPLVGAAAAELATAELVMAATKSTPAIAAPAMFTAPGMRVALPCCFDASARRSDRGRQRPGARARP